MTSSDKLPIKETKKNIVSHALVPPHRLLSEDEKKSILEKFNAKLKQLPRISIKDPIVKTLEGAKIGDVVEIKRSSVTAGEALYYRVIING